MKKLMTICALFAGIWCGNSYAGDFTSTVLTRVAPFNLINWTVGDTQNYDVTLGAMGKVGTMTKSVEKQDDTQNAIWVKTEMNLSIQHDTTEMLMSRTDGKILKFIHNGQEQALPDDKIEVVSQDYTEVTVPAGTFKAIHIVANTKDVKGVEVWANPRDTVMEGTLKQVMPTQFGNVTVELTKFEHGRGLHIQPFPYPCDPEMYLDCTF